MNIDTNDFWQSAPSCILIRRKRDLKEHCNFTRGGYITCKCSERAMSRFVTSFLLPSVLSS